MSKYYQDLDRGHFDYSLVQIPRLPMVVRGPKVDPSRPYFACVGAAQTFGRFCDHPFPELLGEMLGLQSLNLGIGGAGPVFFNRPPILKWLNSAEFVVVQVLSGRSEGNSFFYNSGGNRLMGINLLNGSRMRFESFLEGIVKTWEPVRIRAVIEETRQRYIANARSLLDNIGRPKVLLWLSQRGPEYREDYSTASGILGSFPQLINREVLDALRPHANEFVNCTSCAGIPQELWPAKEPIDGTYLREGKLFNEYYPSPEIHREVADRLVPVCQRLVELSKPLASALDEPATTTPPIERFVILGAERTGTSIVRELLASHPQVSVGGELFNPKLIQQGEIPWWLSFDSIAGNQELKELRVSDPAAFVDALFGLAATGAARVIGFKLMYGHANKDPRVRDFLVADRSFRIIHVKRRNLLRRFLSNRRALQTGRWWVKASEPAPDNLRITLTPESCVADFALIQGSQAKYDEWFKDHEVLELHYEDVCADLQGARSRMLRFLGLPETGPLKVFSQKTGTDCLRDAIKNYDELKAALPEYVEFFED